MVANMPWWGMGAVGEEAGEQRALLGQGVEVRGDAVFVAEGADVATGHAFHEDHHDVAHLGNWPSVGGV